MIGSESGRVILDVLIVLVAAKVGGEIAERLGQPAVLGELALGVAVGPSLAGLITPTPVLGAFAELGAILLLFEVGLETDLAGVLRVGGAALRVASIGVAVPFALGFVAARALGFHTLPAVFIGATLTATSVGITARLLSDLRRLGTDEGRTILGAAVADDVIGLVILAVVSSLIGGGRISAWSVAGIVATSVGFLVAALVAGLELAPPLFGWLAGHLRVRGILITSAFAFCLLLAWTAGALRLAPIVGAFAAGVVLARTREHQQIRAKLAPLADVFIPIFFLSMGIAVDARAVARPAVLGVAALLTLAAVAGKIVSGIGAPAKADRLAVGVGMIPRGEVGLIFASVGLARGVVASGGYSALVLVVVATTFLTPPLAKPLFERLGRERAAGAPAWRSLEEITLGPRW
ncbi:MAG: cation:proton antiporter [Acidobacteria bacterium]|nr:cation:proton antiporter [Acidobacteriota bacterium]